ncbi:MAG: hypothetical protein EPN21_04045 [Methylococcaceae bacterium]|nr:MAG: hypothetical protein EPN21_04045 [Methylococcaceae bacterium]
MLNSTQTIPRHCRGKLGKSAILLMLLSVGGAQHEQIIDAVAAATQVAPPPLVPNISVSPAPVNNTFRVAEGEKITFTVNATDPAGYLSVALLNTTLPAGATFTPTLYDCCYGNARSRVFSWTPAVGTSNTNPVTAIKLIALNWHTAGQRPPYPTRTQTINIVVEDNQAPLFDTSIPRQQSAVVGEALLFPVSVAPDPDDDNAIIKAQKLPPGAILGNAVKNPTTGWWSAVMRWTPTAGQLHKVYKTTFVAQDDNPVSSAQSTYPVTFKVAAQITARSSIQAVRVTQSQWNEQTSRLSVSGVVDFDKNHGLAQGLNIVLTNNKTDAEIASVPVADDGSWHYQGELSSAEVPCGVKATESVGGRIAIYSVKKAPSTCM